MIRLSKGTRIFFAVEPVNMHKSFDGLAMLVQEVIQQSPMNGHVFVFRNKRADKLKMLIWDRNGFFIFYKRVEKGRFKFPKTTDLSVEVNQEELALLLDGIDINKLKRFPTLHYEIVA